MEASAAIRASLRRIYGAAISVGYVDAGQPDLAPAHAEELAALRAEGWPLPLVVLDGEVLFAGAINPLRVVAAVADAWQRGNTEER